MAPWSLAEGSQEASHRHHRLFPMCLRVAEVDSVSGSSTEVPMDSRFKKKLLKKSPHCTNLLTLQQSPVNTSLWVGTGSKDQHLGTTHGGHIPLINFWLTVAETVSCTPICNLLSSIVIETLIFSWMHGKTTFPSIPCS